MIFNENVIMQFMIDHYRNRFPNCNIVFYDNESTDNSVQIALNNNCEVINYPTNNKVDDNKLRTLKNNCWKSAKTDWVLVCDIDEMLDIYEEDLKKEELLMSNIIRSEGWNMVNMENNYDLINIKHGISEPNYSKPLLFNKKYISEINYCYGAHNCSPIGTANYSNNTYRLFHYRYINPDYSLQRLHWTRQRFSDINLRNGWGIQYMCEDDVIIKDFNNARIIAKKII
jgi:hypothetical protein